MSAGMPECVLLEGKKVGERLRKELAAEVENIKAREGVVLRMACVMVGKDPSAEFYRRAQEKCALSLGIAFENVMLDAGAAESELLSKIKELSSDESPVHGLIIQLPLPSHMDVARLYPELNPKKDIEGIHPATLGYLVMRRAKLVPATALACLTLIDETGVDCRAKEVVIIGQSAIVGRPLQLLLGERRATTIVCNTGTPEARMAAFCRGADIVVACAGKPGMVKGDWIKPGAVVIDVGTSDVAGKITGDVEFEEARKKAKFITPVPGGVGPLTVLMLMKNLIAAYRWR